jgi:hypothetical protein
MSDIEFISILYCPMFQCIKMENHSNLHASVVEGCWRSAGTFALFVRRTSFDSRPPAPQTPPSCVRQPPPLHRHPTK